MIKRILFLLCTAAAIAAVFMSPYNYKQSLDKYNELDSALTHYNEAKANVSKAQSGVETSAREFMSTRKSELYFGDIDKLTTVLNNTVGISVIACEGRDAYHQFAPVNSVEDASAVCMSLAVEDMSVALRVVSALELPLYSLAVIEPGTLEVTFLTGG